MNWFKGLFKKNVGAPVHSGANRVWFTDVYETGDFWTFSYFDQNHSIGEVQLAVDKTEAIWYRKNFVNNHKKDQFVHQGVPFEG